MRRTPPPSARLAREGPLAPNAEPAPCAGPLLGRTYSLYGSSATSDGFYHEVAQLADECLRRWPDARAALEELRRASRRKGRLRRLARRGVEDSPAGFAVIRGARALQPYLLDVEAHLAALPLADRFDATLSTTREQYLCHALEIELTNRRHREAFSSSRTKVAFLPHCLRDLARTCKSKPGGVDYACAGCSPSCVVHAASRLLRAHGIEPYLWLTADLGDVLRDGRARPGGLGVLGIACLPELVQGMRACDRAGVPVVGVPLDANRCSRWLGEFRANTVNLGRLEALVSDCGAPG
jgi:hypothetical protein